MPKPSVTVDEKVSILLNKFRDDDVYNEFLNFAKGNFFYFARQREIRMLLEYMMKYANNDELMRLHLAM
jgi:hypothetical protein